MDYTSLIALGVSVVALIISGLGLWLSLRVQHHSQIVSFEQRKQEFRRMFLEENLLAIQIEVELKRLPDNEWRRDKFSQLTASHKLNDTLIKKFDLIPSSPATEARLRLEDLGGKINGI